MDAEARVRSPCQRSEMLRDARAFGRSPIRRRRRFGTRSLLTDVNILALAGLLKDVEGLSVTVATGIGATLRSP